MRVKLHTLQDCKKCKKLKEDLDALNVEYYCITCENDPVDCDKLEELTGSDNYPMVILENRNITEILYIAENYSDLGSIKNKNGIALIPMYSIDNMLSYIKNILN